MQQPSTAPSKRLGSTPSAARSAPAADGRLAALLCFVEAALADPALSPAKVAAANGLSTRHLHRLFRGTGCSFGVHVRRRRLERCREDLADPRLRALPLTEIAYRWGFNCSSHFARSFRATFGMSASDYRRAAADGSAPSGD